MINRLTIRNFKSILDETYEFTNFDLLVGRNNSGKSTILQALAIWQFCINEFHRAKRAGSTGKQVVLPNFTALPVPEFNLLWRERTDRKWPLANGKKKQEYILIEIEVAWRTKEQQERVFGVRLRYNSPQSVYAIPAQSWKRFRELEEEGSLPIIAHVPPFSGLEPIEEWRDDGPIRKQVGKAQPGSVLRNLLLRVYRPPAKEEQGHAERNYTMPGDWVEIKSAIDRWFSVELAEPKYEVGVDTQIVCEYKQDKRLYDIIAGGSGFHQALTLLAFLYGYNPTTMLLDEPDAHLHVNLQREILDYFERKSSERGVQLLIATHAEELVKGVDATRIVSLMNQKPKRVLSAPAVLTAMADVSNNELTALMDSPVMLYVEGESDQRILRQWAKACGAEDILDKVCFHAMGGGTKQQMKGAADRHFEGVTEIVPNARRLMLFDYDTAKDAFHPEPSNPALYEWSRANIENYLLVPEAWERAAVRQLRVDEPSLFATPAKKTITDFFASQNLTLPPRQSWRTVSANIFKVVDGKKLLYEDSDSLFHRLRNLDPPVELIRENVAGGMTADDIHEDVHALFAKIQGIVTGVGNALN
jgi:energy-coupling factor transporter ATP-binding protein EcfA2